MLRAIVLLLCLGFSASTISVPVGSDFTLKCIPDADDPFIPETYNWTFTPEIKDDLKDPDPNLYWTESELIFTPVMQSHAGLYECLARGELDNRPAKRKMHFIVKVEEIPKYTQWWVVEVTEGETAVLPCYVLTPADADVIFSSPRWSRGLQYKEIQPENKTQNSSKETKDEKSDNMIPSGPEESSGSIKIPKVKLEDADDYHCGFTMMTENTLQAKLVKVELIVKPVPPPRCGQVEPWEECIDPDSRSWKATLSESVTEFSLKLFSKLRSLQKTQNLLVSPISIAGLLSHLLLGARGETRTELERSLFLPNHFSCVHSEIKRMKEEIKESMMMASQVLYNPRHMLGEAFINQSKDFYNTIPEKLRNSTEENVKWINAWVSNYTQKKITKLVEFVDPSTELVLLNAVHFIGKWKTVFEDKNKNDNFLTLKGELVSVPVLYSSKYSITTSYFSKLKAQVGKFPLTGESSLYILVPNTVTESALSLLENNLNEENLKAMINMMNTMTPVTAEVTLPKIKLSENTDLIRLLKEMDMPGLFDSPNLCGVFPGDEFVTLTEGRHRVFLSLTEQGVEAVAASSISFSRSYNTFNAMQPFIFIIWSERTSCPLFIGRITNPLEKP